MYVYIARGDGQDVATAEQAKSFGRDEAEVYHELRLMGDREAPNRGPKDHINIRITIW